MNQWRLTIDLLGEENRFIITGGVDDHLVNKILLNFLSPDFILMFFDVLWQVVRPAEKLLGLFGYSLKTLIRHQEPFLVGNRQIDDHTSDILDIFLVLIRTNKLLDIFKDALADLYPEIWVIFDAGRDEMPSLQLVLLLAGRYALRDFITLLIVNLFQLFL